MVPMSTTHDRQVYWAEKQHRAEQSERDRVLCPPPAARVLNLSYRQVAAAMREHDVPGPLTTQQAKWIRSGVAPTPDWLAQMSSPA